MRRASECQAMHLQTAARMGITCVVSALLVNLTLIINKIMTRKETQQLNYFPEGLDAAVIKKFGKQTKCQTTYNFFTGKHATFFKAEGQKKKDIQLFIDAFILGNIELKQRLLSLKK